MSSRRAYTVLLITLYAVIVRLVPVFVTNMPFSNDVWPLIRIAQALGNGMNVSALHEDPVYGHHVQWPFSVLTIALYSGVAGMSSLLCYQYVGTCLVGLTLTLLAYVLGNRLFNGRVESALFALALSAYPSFVAYTSAFLKEVYTHLVMLTFLAWVFTSSTCRTHFLVPVFAASLVLGHPLPSIILALVLALYYIDGKVQTFRSRKAPKQISWKLAAFALILLILVIVYNGAIARRRPIPLNSVDVALLVAYAVTAYVAYVLLGSGGSSYFLGAFVVMTAVVAVRAVTSPLSYSLVLYVTPPLLVLLVSGIKGAGESKSSNPHTVTVAPLLLVISTGFLYITTYFTQVLGLLHRLLNYLVYAIAVLMASMARRNAGKAIIVAGMCVVITLISICAASAGFDPLLSYWKYSEVDRELEVYVTRFLADGGVYGDPKYSYFMAGLVNHVPLNALVNTCEWLGRSQELLLLSYSNLKHGVPVSPVDFVKIKGSVFACGDLLFNAGDLWVFG